MIPPSPPSRLHPSSQAPLLSPVQHDCNRRAVRPKECHRVQVALLAGNQPHSLRALGNELAEVGTGLSGTPALRVASISLSLEKSPSLPSTPPPTRVSTDSELTLGRGPVSTGNQRIAHAHTSTGVEDHWGFLILSLGPSSPWHQLEGRMSHPNHCLWAYVT